MLSLGKPTTTRNLPEPEGRDDYFHTRRSNCSSYASHNCHVCLVVVLLSLLFPTSTHGFQTQQPSLSLAISSSAVLISQRHFLSFPTRSSGTISSVTSFGGRRSLASRPLSSSRLRAATRPPDSNNNNNNARRSKTARKKSITFLSRSSSGNDSSNGETQPLSSSSWLGPSRQSTTEPTSVTSTSNALSSFDLQIPLGSPSSNGKNVLNKSPLTPFPPLLGEVPWDSQKALLIVATQSVLAVLALVFAFFLDISLSSMLVVPSSMTAVVGGGVVATLPLFGMAWLLDRLEPEFPALQRVTQATQRSVLYLLGSQFRPWTSVGMSLALGMAAGIGEELLFRGVLQTALTEPLAQWLGLLSPEAAATSLVAWPAIVVTSIVFGSLHAVTPLYAILAGIASLYFGWMATATAAVGATTMMTTTTAVVEMNLLLPIFCHTLYDVAALLYAHWTVTQQLSPEDRQELLDSL